MTFGDAIKLMFEAHYEDLASSKNGARNTRYTHEKLKCALNVVPWNWRKHLYEEFSVVVRVLRENLLSCEHTSLKEPYPSRIECMQCGCHRSLELEDQDPNSYNECKVWSEWRV